MHTYRQVIELLPSFAQKSEPETKFALWDAMDAAYRAGMKDAKEIMDRSWQNGKEHIDNLISPDQ